MKGNTALGRKIHSRAGLIQNISGASDSLAAASAHFARGDDSEEFASTLFSAAEHAHHRELDLFVARAVMQVRLFSGAAVAYLLDCCSPKFCQQGNVATPCLSKKCCIYQLQRPLQACTGIYVLVQPLHKAEQSPEDQGGRAFNLLFSDLISNYERSYRHADTCERVAR
jgi:hypothetical protein